MFVRVCVCMCVHTGLHSRTRARACVCDAAHKAERGSVYHAFHVILTCSVLLRVLIQDPSSSTPPTLLPPPFIIFNPLLLDGFWCISCLVLSSLYTKTPQNSLTPPLSSVHPSSSSSQMAFGVSLVSCLVIACASWHFTSTPDMPLPTFLTTTHSPSHSLPLTPAFNSTHQSGALIATPLPSSTPLSHWHSRSRGHIALKPLREGETTDRLRTRRAT